MTTGTTTSPADAEAYRSHRQAAAERSREKASAGQDIGDIPAVVNPRRRARALKSFRIFCETYFADTFALKWSADHLKVIGKIEDAVLRGGQQAIAMPRGSGKTSLCERACIWAPLKGGHKYLVLIGADETAATVNLETIYTELETNDLLLEDFPEVCYPIRRIEGVHQRKLRYKGERIHYEFTAKRMVLPTIPGSPAADAVIDCAGITARLRGRKYTRRDGGTSRPDLVLIDDPQTDETAKSPSQVAERERIVSGAVLGMAGPGKNISALMTVTVIQPDDFADRVLNRKLHPEWHGEKTKMLYAIPTDMKLWEEYWQIRSEEMQADGDGSKSRTFYRKNRRAMDAGAVVAWKERYKPGELSAIQHAMNLRFANPEAFAAECQNEPMAPKPKEMLVMSAEKILEHLNGTPRGVVPQSASRLTGFIDVQGGMLFWLVLATADDFTGAIVDYGAFPDQKRSYFTLADAKRKVMQAAAAAGATIVGVEGAIYWALTELTNDLLTREWRREDGAHLKIEKCPIDASWGESTDTVYQFCRSSKFSAIVMPSHGRFVGASSRPFSEWAGKPGDRIGLHWRIPVSPGRRTIRHLLIDTNWWKTFVHARLALGIGDRGAFSLSGSRGEEHRLMADHLTAEAPILTTAKDRSVNEWKLRAPGLDNHWLDGLVGAAVAASIQGAKLLGVSAEGQRRARKKYTSADFARVR
jgi:hypothetical protein